MQVSQSRPSRTRVAAGLSHVKVPWTSVTYVQSSDLLADVRFQVEGVPGLTDCCRYLRSESEVSALGFGTYIFTESVYEITLCPRPASPVSTHIVETDHPRIHFSMSTTCARYQYRRTSWTHKNTPAPDHTSTGRPDRTGEGVPCGPCPLPHRGLRWGPCPDEPF